MVSAPDPLVSIVIPAYNYAATLARAVESVLAQAGRTHELIVIDDGSTDETPQVTECLQSLYAGRLRVIRKANGGASSARNRGIHEARGKYLLFLDADDELASGALAALEAHLSVNLQTRMVIGGHWAVQPDGRRRLHLPEPLPDVAFDRVKAYLLDKRVSLSNGACAMHREVFSRGTYPESFRSAEDIPVFAQVLANYPCTVLSEPLALIHKHDDSLRHQFSYAKAGGVMLVDEVFAPTRLGAEFQALRPKYLVQRNLSLFRSAYRAGDLAAAKSYFRTALEGDWGVLLKGAYVRKALWLWLKSNV